MMRQKTLWGTSGTCKSCNNRVLGNAVERWECSCEEKDDKDCKCTEGYEVHYAVCSCGEEMK